MTPANAHPAPLLVEKWRRAAADLELAAAHETPVTRALFLARAETYRGRADELEALAPPPAVQGNINPAFWIEAIRIARHTTDCADKERTLANAADLLEAYAAAAAERVRALEAERDAARKLLSDLADNGLRFSLNPCHDMSSKESIETFWHGYMRSADERIRERARTFLTQGLPTDGR